MVKISELPTSPDTDTRYIPAMQQRHVSWALARSLPVPQLPGNSHLPLRSLHDFTDEALEAHRLHLTEAGLRPPSDRLFHAPSWPLIAAALERWNPDTHTFFFGVGELTVLLEEVPLLLAVPADPATRPSYRAELPELRDLLRPITHDGAQFDHLTRDGRLNVRRLWDSIRDDISSPAARSQQRARFGLLLVIAGTYLFPDPHGFLSREHVALVEHHLYRERGSLAQPILAHLYAGMDSAAMGGPFFGSPYLLSFWLEQHFSFGTQLAGPPGQQTRVPTSAPRADLRRMFDRLSDRQTAFSLPGVTSVLLPVHPRSECVLAGATHFAVYSAHRCTRQFSSDFSIPHPRGHVPRVEARTYSDLDARRFDDSRVHWECHVLARGLFQGSDEDDLVLRQRRYRQWMDQHTVSDLGVVARVTTSHGIPVPSAVPTFEEFERRTRHRR